MKKISTLVLLLFVVLIGDTTTCRDANGQMVNYLRVSTSRMARSMW